MGISLIAADRVSFAALGPGTRLLALSFRATLNGPPPMTRVGEVLVSPEGSVSRWLLPLRDGDPAAIEELWQRYFVRLVELARSRLRQVPRGADEEDVALSAFDSVCRSACQGRLPQLQDRDDLWRLLATVTARKACRLLRNEGRYKRGGGHAFNNGASGADADDLLEQVISSEPSPQMALQLTEEYHRLLGLLG